MVQTCVPCSQLIDYILYKRNVVYTSFMTKTIDLTSYRIIVAEEIDDS